MPDFSDKRIGGALILPPDPRNIRLERLTDIAALPPIPAGRIDIGAHVPDWGMHYNDRLGDCVPAAAANQIEADSSDTGTEQVIPDADVIAAYSAVAGYDPRNPATDIGTDPEAFFNWWRKTGLGGRKIKAWATVERTNIPLLRAALWLCGGLQITLQLPNSAKLQSIWDVVPDDGGVWGGHQVFGIRHDQSSNAFSVVTWDVIQPMTEAFLARYGVLVAATIPDAWFSGTGQAPSGFDIAGLERWLTVLSGQPDPGPPAPAPWAPNPSVVAWLNWRQAAGAYVLSQYLNSAAGLAPATAEESVIAQYEPSILALLRGEAHSLPAAPPESR